MRNSVVIVGGGLMGSGIAAVSALAGNRTVIVDKSSDLAEKGVIQAKKNITELAENGLALLENSQATADQLFASPSLEQALEQAEFVIESINENLALKQMLFQTIDGFLPPEVPIASNTSGLRITDISALTRHPERTVSTHFWFPGHVVPLVEVVVGEKSSLDIARDVQERMRKWGKTPVLVLKDMPGQLANRIYQAVIREAINILSIGLASPEDVDIAIKMGMGIRFPIMGPLEHLDTIGLDLALSVQNSVLPVISHDISANQYLVDLLAQGHNGVKSGQGFYDWSNKNLQEIQDRRNQFIMNAVKLIKNNL